MLDFLSFVDDIVSSLFLLTDRDKSTGKDRAWFFVKRMVVLTIIVLCIVAAFAIVFFIVNSLFLHW